MNLSQFQIMAFFATMGLTGIIVLAYQCWMQLNELSKLRSRTEMAVEIARGYRDYLLERGHYRDFKQWREGPLTDLVPWFDPRKADHKPDPAVLASIHEAFKTANDNIKATEEAEVVLITPPPVTAAEPAKNS